MPPDLASPLHQLPALLGVVSALTVGVVSPGPSFVMVARTAVSTSRANGVAAAIGMGVGGVAFATAALLGLHTLLTALPSVYLVLKAAGGLYLAWLGLRIWAAARQPLAITGAAIRPAAMNVRKSFVLGLSTQISNPKTAVVYASVFAAFLPAAPSGGFAAVLVVAVFCVETIWYAIVATALASQRPRNAYLRYKRWIDRTAGGVMMALGLELVASARP